MKLSSILRPGCVVARLAAADKWGCIGELLDRLVRNELVGDRESALGDIQAREAQMSTGMEKGLAIPHARSRSVSQIAIAVGISPGGIEFGSLDGKPARAIFLVLFPEGVAGPYIECMAQITRFYSRRQNRDRLLKAQSAEEILDMLS